MGRAVEGGGSGGWRGRIARGEDRVAGGGGAEVGRDEEEDEGEEREGDELAGAGLALEGV